MQQTAALDFDIAYFKSTIEQAPTKENGWNLEYEGKVDKDFKGTFYYHNTPSYISKIQ